MADTTPETAELTLHDVLEFRHGPIRNRTMPDGRRYSYREIEVVTDRGKVTLALFSDLTSRLMPTE